MPQGGNLAKFLLNGYDVSAYFRNVSFPGMGDVYDSTTFGQTNKTYIGGLKDGTLTASGFWDATSSGTVGSDPYLQAAFAATAAPVLTLYPYGDTLGYTGRGLNGFLSTYSIDSPVDGLVTISAEAKSNTGGVERVLSHTALSAIASGSQTGTSIDNAASSANGGVGYLEVTAIAATTATIKIQHSSDNSVWVDLITFTAVTAAPAKERIAVTGTVERYTRRESNASGGTVTAQVSFGRK